MLCVAQGNLLYPMIRPHQVDGFRGMSNTLLPTACDGDIILRYCSASRPQTNNSECGNKTSVPEFPSWLFFKDEVQLDHRVCTEDWKLYSKHVYIQHYQNPGSCMSRDVAIGESSLEALLLAMSCTERYLFEHEPSRRTKNVELLSVLRR